MKNAINKLRKKHGMKIEELCLRLCTTRSMVNKLISGDRMLNDFWIEKLTNIFGCTVGELYGEEGLSAINDGVFLAAARSVRKMVKHMPDTPENREKELRIILLAYPFALEMEKRGEPIEFDDKIELSIFKAFTTADSST